MLLDLAYVGNKADDLVLIANYNQAAVNNAAGSLSPQARRPIQEFSDVTYVLQRRQVALQRLPDQVRVASARPDASSSLTLSKAKDNGAQSLENQNGNFPGPQDFTNLAAAVGSQRQPGARRAGWRLAAVGHQHGHAR